MNLYSLSNPTRVLYPKQNITKLELAEYYDAIQDWILPYVIKRPLTLVRCPTGRHKDCFYQKHLTNERDVPNLYPIPIQEKLKTSDYLYIKNFRGLVALVQLGVLEIHLWNCHVDAIEKPDMVIFDLDPAPDVPWKNVVSSAHYLREVLGELELYSFVKTTGGKGLHLVLPIRRNYTWDQIRSFSEKFVEAIVDKNPHQYIGTMSKAKRTGKIFIDYFRNNRGSTSIAPFSTRAREGATVSTPLDWKELTARLNPQSLNVKTIPLRLAKLTQDPWEGFLEVKQKLPFS